MYVCMDAYLFVWLFICLFAFLVGFVLFCFVLFGLFSISPFFSIPSFISSSPGQNNRSTSIHVKNTYKTTRCHQPDKGSSEVSLCISTLLTARIKDSPLSLRKGWHIHTNNGDQRKGT